MKVNKKYAQFTKWYGANRIQMEDIDENVLWLAWSAAIDSMSKDYDITDKVREEGNYYLD